LLLLLALLGAGAYAWRSATLPYHPLRQAAGSSAQADAKVAQLQQAVDQANAQHKPVPFSQTFTDAELTRLANENLGSGSVFSSVTIHANQGGYMEGAGIAHLAGQNLPLYVRAAILVSGDRVSVDVREARLGTLAAPGPLATQISAAVQNSIPTQNLPSLTGLSVVVSDGSITISGTAQPG